MFVYHCHATKQQSVGTITNLDGIAQMMEKVETMEHYMQLKELIANIPDGKDIGGAAGLTICSLSFLHETANV